MVHAFYLNIKSRALSDRVMLIQSPAMISRSLVETQRNRRPMILLRHQSAFRSSTEQHETNNCMAVHRKWARYRSCAEGGVYARFLSIGGLSAFEAQRGTRSPWGLKLSPQLALLTGAPEALLIVVSVRTSASMPKDLG